MWRVLSKPLKASRSDRLPESTGMSPSPPPQNHLKSDPSCRILEEWVSCHIPLKDVSEENSPAPPQASSRACSGSKPIENLHPPLPPRALRVPLDERVQPDRHPPRRGGGGVALDEPGLARDLGVLARGIRRIGFDAAFVFRRDVGRRRAAGTGWVGALGRWVWVAVAVRWSAGGGGAGGEGEDDGGC